MLFNYDLNKCHWWLHYIEPEEKW